MNDKGQREGFVMRGERKKRGFLRKGKKKVS